MMTDPIADILTRIRNASLKNHKQVTVRFSKMKQSIADVLLKSKMIKSVQKIEEEKLPYLTIDLLPNRPLSIKRVSSPGRHIYTDFHHIPKVKNGLGIAIISTSKGIMSNKEVKKHNVGGEIICEVY
jgi:small subunit ribosomal protein S8